MQSPTSQTAPPPSRGNIGRIALYAILLMLLFNLGTQGVAGLPMQLVLKDRLKLPANQIALFNFLTDAPFYVGFALGFLRDRWRPLGRGDRGYFLLVPPLMVATYLVLMSGPLTFPRLVVAFFLLTLFSVLLGAAANGLLAAVAQHNGMTGRISIILLVTSRAVGIFSSSEGGRLSDPAHPQTRTALLASAVLAALMMVMGLWKPRAVFAQAGAMERAVPEQMLGAIRRLVRQRSIYLPALILLLWNFAPGWGTPLLYYLTNTVKLSNQAYGNVRAVLGAGALVFTLLYGPLCRRFHLKPLMVWGTVLGVLGGAIFLLIHNATQAYIVAFLAGGSCGIAVATYYDLLVRCCPRELEGAAFMFTTAAMYIAGDTSDLFGSWLYEHGGFKLALGVTVLTTGLILPVLLFIPRHLTASREGERFHTTASEFPDLTPEAEPA